MGCVCSKTRPAPWTQLFGGGDNIPPPDPGNPTTPTTLPLPLAGLPLPATKRPSRQEGSGWSRLQGNEPDDTDDGRGTKRELMADNSDHAFRRSAVPRPMPLGEAEWDETDGMSGLHTNSKLALFWAVFIIVWVLVLLWLRSGSA